MSHVLRDYKPAASKPVLLFLAGLAWICVGAMLLSLAVSWLSAAAGASRYLYGALGIALGVLAQRFIFSRVADKNLHRLIPLEEKKCVFSFIPWKSYFIILVMIAMGSTLRHSSIPKDQLAVIYTAIGLALTLSSLRYLKAFWQEVTS